MLKDYQLIISKEVQEVLKSPELYLKLLKLYSVLFLNGKSPSTCEKCAINYYNEIKTKGLKKIQIMENRTCKLKEGSIYNVRVGNAIITYTNANITDEIAIRLLASKQLKESNFVKLPVIPAEKTEEEKPKKVVKKRTPKAN